MRLKFWSAGAVLERTATAGASSSSDNYTRFDGTRWSARVHADGSVDGGVARLHVLSAAATICSLSGRACL